jgi:hypothetical protein
MSGLWNLLHGGIHDPVSASWVQAAIYFVTLVVLVYQARILIRQTKSQEEALRLQTKTIQQGEYLRCQIDFTESMRTMLTSGHYKEVYDELARGGSRFAHWTEYSEAQKATYGYLELIHELFERVFVLHMDNWIEPQEWSLWEEWFKDAAINPIYRDVFEDNLGMYDPRFESYARSALELLESQATNGTKSSTLES